MKTYSMKSRGGLFFRGESSYGVPTADPLTFVRCESCLIPSDMEFAESADLKQGDYRNPGTWLGDAKEFKLTGGLHPHQTTWPVAALDIDSVRSPLLTLLAGVFGESIAGGFGTLDTTGSTAKVLKFISSGEYAVAPSVLGFRPGEGLAVREPGADTVLGFAVIQEVNDAAFTVTLRNPLESVPAASSTVFGGWTAAKLALAGNRLPSAELVTLGGASFDLRRALGCTVKQVVIDCPYGQKPTIEITFHGHPQPLVIGETGGDPAVQSYPYPEPVQVLHGAITSYDGTTLEVLEGGFKLTIDVLHGPVRGIHRSDPHGYQDALCGGRNVTLELTPAYTSNAWHALQTTPGSRVITCHFGMGPAVIGAQLPAAHLISAVTDSVDGETKTLGLTLGDGVYAGDVGTFDPTTDAGNSSAMLWWLAGE